MDMHAKVALLAEGDNKFAGKALVWYQVESYSLYCWDYLLLLHEMT